MLAGWGRFVHRFRFAVIALSLASLAPSLWLIAHGGRLATTDVPTTTESGRALDLIGRELPGPPAVLQLHLQQPHPSAQDPAFRREVEAALAPLRSDERVARVVTAYDPPVYDASVPAAEMISRDGRRALAVVELKGESAAFSSLEFSVLPPDVYPSLRAKVKTETLEMLPVGNIPLNHDFTEVTRTDLQRAELVILPLVVDPAAARVRLGGGRAPAAPGRRALDGGRHRGHAAHGPLHVGVGLRAQHRDHDRPRGRDRLLALHREPLSRGDPRAARTPEALARTMATAGRAILFSGLTVAIGLLGMVFLGLGNIGSIGWAGTVVVSLAVVYAPDPPAGAARGPGPPRELAARCRSSTRSAREPGAGSGTRWRSR